MQSTPLILVLQFLIIFDTAVRGTFMLTLLTNKHSFLTNKKRENQILKC